MRQLRLRIRTIMAAIVLLALALTFIVQLVLAQQALIRRERLRAEAEDQRWRTARSGAATDTSCHANAVIGLPESNLPLRPRLGNNV